MGANKDPRRQIGAKVHAKAGVVTNQAQCSRLYGSQAKHKLVNGTVLDVLVDRSSGRASTSLRVEWTLTTFPTTVETVRTLKLCNIRDGEAPDTTPNTAQSVNGVKEINERIATAEPNEGDTVSLDQRRLMEQQSWDQWAEISSLPPHISLKLPDSVAHGTAWFEEDVTTPIGGYVPRSFWSIRASDGSMVRENGGIRSRTPLDCFMSMFPYEQLLLIKELTEKRLFEKGKRGTSVKELLRFFGIFILITRFEFGNMADLWSTEPRSKYIPAPCFGKTGVSRDRFQGILSAIRFSRQPEKQGDMLSVQWRCQLVQDFIDSINKHRECSVVPGELLCIDESISRWYGRGGHWIDVGLPQYVAIERKPENGCKIQDICCGCSGIIIRLELVTTAENEAAKEAEEDLLHGTVVMKRLVKPWAGSGRIVCADSYFASVSAADMLLQMGFKFIGFIKTATKKYPISFLFKRKVSERVQRMSVVPKSLTGSVDMMAVMWMNRERRYFISTTFTTEDKMPHVRKRWRQLSRGPARVELTVPEPKVCEVYYSACAQIDRHNRCRQDHLNMEKKVRTKDWSFRVKCSLLSMIIVDSWLCTVGLKGLGNI